MGTHPIFESDFDCLTERRKQIKQQHARKVGSNHRINAYGAANWLFEHDRRSNPGHRNQFQWVSRLGSTHMGRPQEFLQDLYRISYPIASANTNNNSRSAFEFVNSAYEKDWDFNGYARCQFYFSLNFHI